MTRFRNIQPNQLLPDIKTSLKQGLCYVCLSEQIFHLKLPWDYSAAICINIDCLIMIMTVILIYVAIIDLVKK